MANHHYNSTTKAEYGTDLAIEDATSLGTCLTLDIDTFVIKGYILQSINIILTKVANNAIRTSDRNGQSATIVLEAATNTHIL